MLDSTPVNSSGEVGTPGLDLDEITRWLRTLHADSPGLIWVGSTDNMVGYTASDVEDVLANIQALEYTEPKGIYLRTTTLARIPIDPATGKKGRGYEQDSFTLPGFAADLDIAGAGHKTSNILPPDVATAMSIVTESGLPAPTMWVHSGGGLYPWWLLEEPQDIRDPQALARAKELSEKIQKILVVTGQRLGWHVGGEVGDMARILRIPGTVNRKIAEDPKPCVILTDHCTYDHYHFTELETLVGEIHVEIPKPELPAYTPRVTTPGSDLSPLDDWEARSDWEMIPGWPFELAEIKGYERRWLRIGSASGAKWSATTGHATDRDRLYCWTPETIFEPRKPYNMQAAYVLLTQGSLSREAFAQATRELRAQGYGGELPKFDYAPDALSLVRPVTEVLAAIKAMDDHEPAQAALVVQANESLPVLGHDGLPEFSDDVYRSQPWDDMGLVSMYSSAFCRALRYVNAMDEWRVWNGQRWVRDDLQLHQLASRKLATGLRDQARKAEREDNEHAKEMKAAAGKLATMGKVMSLPKLARTDRCMSSTPKDYDQHKYLVTVENGTLNLKTGELTDFDPDLMLTKKIKAVYDPDADGPRTMAFLNQVQPDSEVLDYMQRLVGATVLGNADERVLPIIHGASGSGKSAFLEMLYHVLADFAAVADPTTLMPQPDNYQGPSEKLHSLMGTRFVKMSELPENASLNQALVKSITGSDTQKTRPLYGHPVEWDVEYVVWMATNNLPKITSTDGAIWKRVKPIHFPNVFVNEDGSVKSAGDRDLGRQLAREEGSFILNWIMVGVAEYLKLGLAEPVQIGMGLTQYRDDMDTTRQFVAEAQENGQIKVEEGLTIPARDLYKIYMAWTVDAQIKYPLSAQTFKQRMQVNGYEQVKTNAANLWKGIGAAGFLAQAQTPSGGVNQYIQGRMRT